MIRSLVVSASLVAGLFASFPVAAQGASREKVQMDRDTFLSMFQWDELSSQWVMKSGMAMPEGVKSRAEVVAMLEDFLKMHRWDDLNSEWVPNGGKPRDMSKLTRDQVHMETVRFLMMYRYDEASSQWVSKMRGR